MSANPSPRGDVYARVTDKIIADLERGVCPWMKPWNAEHAAGRITRPLRATGEAYKGIKTGLAAKDRRSRFLATSQLPAHQRTTSGRLFSKGVGSAVTSRIIHGLA